MRTSDFMAAVIGGFLLLLSASSGAWTIDEDFDGQVVGARCAPFWDDGADSKISPDKGSSGNNSCKMSISKGAKTWGGGFVPPSYYKKGDEAWIRFRLFIPAGFDFNAYSAGDRLKFVRMTVRDSAKTVGRLDWYWMQEGKVPPFAQILERDQCSTNCWQYFGSAGDTPVRGRWETYEIYAKFDHVSVDDGGQGRVRTWKNGKLMGDLTNRPTMWAGTIEISSFMIFSHWNGGSPATQHLYLDDLAATNVTPSARDSFGNPYIGTGNFVSVADPLPPSSIQ